MLGRAGLCGDSVYDASLQPCSLFSPDLGGGQLTGAAPLTCFSPSIPHGRWVGALRP